jgi:hypothetical protein
MTGRNTSCGSRPGQEGWFSAAGTHGGRSGCRDSIGDTRPERVPRRCGGPGAPAAAGARRGVPQSQRASQSHASRCIAALNSWGAS